MKAWNLDYFIILLRQAEQPLSKMIGAQASNVNQICFSNSGSFA